jgi:hypothetical protein
MDEPFIFHDNDLGITVQVCRSALFDGAHFKVYLWPPSTVNGPLFYKSVYSPESPYTSDIQRAWAYVTGTIHGEQTDVNWTGMTMRSWEHGTDFIIRCCKGLIEARDIARTVHTKGREKEAGG